MHTKHFTKGGWLMELVITVMVFVAMIGLCFFEGWLVKH